MPTETKVKPRPVARVEDEEDELEDLDTEDTPAPKGRPKKEAPVIKPSQALLKRADYDKQIRSAAEELLNQTKEELKDIEPGHPNYGQLKFTKIRMERILLSLNEMKRGQPIRSIS